MFQPPATFGHRELSLAVVGLQFPNPDKSNRRFEAELCAPGDLVELRPEPRNRADPRAIAVYSERGIQLGYLTAERCGWIGGLLDQPWQALFQELQGSVAIIRARFGGGAPTLPAPTWPLIDDEEAWADPPASEWGA